MLDTPERSESFEESSLRTMSGFYREKPSRVNFSPLKRDEAKPAESSSASVTTAAHSAEREKIPYRPNCAPHNGGLAMLPAEVIFDKNLSPTDKLILAALLTYARRDQPEAWPAQDTLADQLGLSADTIQRSEAKLAQQGLIESRRERKADGKLGKRIVNATAVFTLIGLILKPAQAQDRTPIDALPSQAASMRCGTKPRPCGFKKNSPPKGYLEVQQTAAQVRQTPPGSVVVFSPSAKTPAKSKHPAPDIDPEILSPAIALGVAEASARSITLRALRDGAVNVEQLSTAIDRAARAAAAYAARHTPRSLPALFSRALTERWDPPASLPAHASDRGERPQRLVSLSERAPTPAEIERFRGEAEAILNRRGTDWSISDRKKLAGELWRTALVLREI